MYYVYMNLKIWVINLFNFVFRFLSLKTWLALRYNTLTPYTSERTSKNQISSRAFPKLLIIFQRLVICGYMLLALKIFMSYCDISALYNHFIFLVKKKQEHLSDFFIRHTKGIASLWGEKIPFIAAY